MYEAKQKSTGIDERQKQIGLWMAGIFTALGLVLAVLSLYTVIVNQHGQFHLEDAVLLPTLIVISALSIVSYFLIRRERHQAGTALLFTIMLLLPLIAIFLVNNFQVAVATFMATFVPLMFTWVIPKTARRRAVIQLAVAILIMVGIEIWNPGFRGTSTVVAKMVPYLVMLAAMVLAAFVVRQTWGRSVRNKFTTIYVGITLFTAGALAVYMYISTSNLLRQSLEKELTQHTQGVTNQISSLMNEQVNTITTLSLNEVLLQTVEEINKTYAGMDKNAIQSALNTRDTQWRAADAANNNNDPLVREYLNNQAALTLKNFQKAFPDHVEVFITDAYGGQAGTTDRTSDYMQSDEGWWQAAYNSGKGALYISQPEYDESSKAIAVLFAMPMRDRYTGKIVGILRTTYQVSALSSILGEVVGKTGETDIIFPGETSAYFHAGQYEPIETKMFDQVQAVADKGLVQMDFEGVSSVVVETSLKTKGANPSLDSLGWIVVYHQSQNEAFTPINTLTRGVLIVTLVILLIALAGAYIFSLYLVRPISQLTQTAEEVAAGNLDSRANVSSTDEIGTLASTFNSMTSQLQETLSGLEQRVAARTKDLATVAEVGTATATILESKRLLQEVVDLTKERFNLYHSHIYLLDEGGKNLVLTAGAGEPGRVMVAEGRSIPLDREQSLVARAARERKGVTVNDVTQAPDFLPNPLLPDTRSELAVPMIVGGNVIGVFDIQSEQVGRFTDSDVNIQTTLAAQLATSIQNVRSFEQSRKQAELETMVNLIGQRIQRTTSIEETLQTAIRELGTAIGASRVKARISRSSDNN